jgi:uncharacterized damage-inducible protein DinB
MTTYHAEPGLIGDEVTMLRGWLDYHRDVLRRKCEGLTQDQLAQRLEPSTMTLGGMLKHLALVEDWWFSRALFGNEWAEPFRAVDWEADQDWDWNSARHDTPEQLRALHDELVAASERHLDRALAEGGLDLLSHRFSERDQSHFSLRWIVTHMIEEYARHNGHADLIRESIDGLTGE